MTRLLTTLMALSCFIGLHQPGTTYAAQSVQSHPRVYLTRAGLERIRAAVTANQQPWTAAYNGFIASANAALGTTPRSVTTSGKYPGLHDYRTEAPYTTKDGVADPSVDRADYLAAMAVTHAVRDLGLAYALTEQSRYAAKALQLIKVWALDAGTRMTPKFTNGQSQIELCITMPALIYGADLMWDYPGWSTGDRAAFQSWVAALLASARAWSAEQNFENWRHVLIASAAAFLDDVASMDYAFARYRAMIPAQMSTTGRMVKEINRTRSLFYSTYAINAMTQTAEIARVHGVDLYGYTTSTGKSLRKAVDYHVPYVLSPGTWPYQQITPYVGDNAALYELAHAQWTPATYLQVVNRWGRPMNEDRIMGPVTLTHADGIQCVAATTPVYSLLSTEKLTAASSTLAPDHPASHLVDGCTQGTPACTTGAYGIGSFFVEFDLGRSFRLTQASVFGDAEGTWVSTAWMMQYRSAPGEAWRTAFADSPARTSGWAVRTLSGITARYVRFEIAGNASAGTQARELQLLGR